ncbi:MAG: hypothetical protein M1839_008347 [Geoglossum umbratile]|nr:MAG: hypothetical protein M1839_008347 [Geoglossum umbratile]
MFSNNLRIVERDLTLVETGGDFTSQGIACSRNCLNAFTPVNARNSADTDENHTIESGDVREDEDNDEVDGEEDHVEEGGDSDEVDRREDEGGKEGEQTEVSRAGATKADPMKELQCGCASICSSLLPYIPPADDRIGEEEGPKLPEWSHDLHWANFCKNHLRRLTGGGLDMYTLKKTDDTINVDGMFNYILKLETFKLIKEEFDIYLYYLCDEQDEQKC